ncbi:MAG: FtsQ-type POTRA domain-containing protein [Bacillota bacterium]|nr:FtsQ-type POTRA domain-containing protein [Bacillota bacterium]
MEKTQNKYSFGRHELIEQRKDNKRIKSKLVIIFLFIAVNIFLLLFLRSDIFTIAEISIHGVDKLSHEEIRTTMGIREGMNIWKISPPELKKRILIIPRVNDAKVERILPDNLNITITEKIPLILVPYHGYYLELAPDGIFIGIRESYNGELPLVNGLLWGRMDVGTGIPDQSRGEIVQEFLEVLNEIPSLPLAEINVENPQQIIVYTWEGMEVWLGNTHNLSKKIEVMQHIYHRVISLENDPKSGYLDLRVTEAPVFRPIEK